MSGHVHSGGAWRTASSISVWAGGAWRTVQDAWVWSGGAWRPFFTAYVAPTVAATDINNIHLGIGTAFDTSTATVTGGEAPFAYAWSYVSGSSQIVLSDATSQTATFSSDWPSNINGSRTAIYRVTVTDARGSTATADITVTFENEAAL